MKRLRAALVTLSLATPLTATAADVTRLATSFEEDDPFGLFIDLGFERTQHRAQLVRERVSGSGVVEVPELRYKSVDSRLNLGFAAGLYKDLELRFGVPIVFQMNESWGYNAGVDATSSTVTNNCVNPNGTVTDPTCAATGIGNRPLFAVPNQTFRGGLGNMRFGLAYAFFNQKKDDTKPTWIVGLDYEAPTAKLLDPSAATSEGSRGTIGDRTHKYSFYTAISRRIGAVDPYFRAHITAPYRGPGWYSNCDTANPDAMGRPESCGVGPWTREETGIRVPVRAGALFGSEFNVWEEAEKKQKVALDVRLQTQYVGAGRYYNELSGVLGKLNYSEDYLQVGGTVGFSARTTDFFQLRASGTYLYNTDHTITAESMGKDLDGNGQVDAGTDEVNPNFDARIDQVSRRFRAVQANVFRFDLTASFSF